MYSKEDMELALSTYERLGSVSRTVELLGFPNSRSLYRWIETSGRHVSGPGARGGRRGVQSAERPAPARREGPGRGREPTMDPAELPDDPDELKRMCMDLRLEVDLMREVLALVKKGPRADPRSLTNREKAALIDALRGTYSVSCLASRLGIPPSSYYYARKAAEAPDRHAAERAAVAEEFEAAGGRRGYRWIRHRLAVRGIKTNEKQVRRIMRELGLQVVYNGRKRGYDSYAGEATPAPENLVGRNFHAEAPNALWLTDITEFRLPGRDEKVYLSPIIDCFDGMLVSWSIGTSPTAELANSSLELACDSLAEGEAPIIHSDRGGHYRWRRWIEICAERGLTRSMSAKGCSPDNAAAEGFFGRLKNEFFYYRDWSGTTVAEFEDELDAWLVWYNNGREKESLGWMSPAQYRRSLAGAA